MRLFPVLMTVFIDSLGFGLVYPIFSILLMDQKQGFLPLDISLSMRGWVFGLLVSGFCLGQFFGGPILGALSDRKGRKKILGFSLGLAAFSYALTSIGIIFHNVIVLFLSRLLGGVAAGNWSVAQTVVVDTSNERERSKNFGLLGMAWGTGFVIGPYLGGKFSDSSLCAVFNLTTPFWIACFLCIVNIIFLLMKLEESSPNTQVVKISLSAGIQQLKGAFCSEKLGATFLVVFVFYIGWGFFTEFCPIFLMQKFHFTGAEVANFYASIGLWIALYQGIIIRPFLLKFSPSFLIIISLMGMGSILTVMCFINVKYFIYLSLPVLCFFWALLFPSIATFISNLSDKGSEGQVLGIYNSVQWAAIGLMPLFSGSFVVLNPSLPFIVGSIAMFSALILFIANDRQKKLFC